MGINFNTIIKGVDGKPMPKQMDIKQCPYCGAQDGVKIPFGERDLKSVVVDALNFPFADEGPQAPHPISGEERAKRGILTLRIMSNPTRIVLKAEEKTLLKQLIGKGLFSSFVVTQAHNLIEEKDQFYFPIEAGSEEKPYEELKEE